MTASNDPLARIPPYKLSGRQRFAAWAETQPEITRLEVGFWLSGLYWKPWQAPSIPLAAPGTESPDDVRRAVLLVEGLASVTIDYDVWEQARVVRILRIR